MSSTSRRPATRQERSASAEYSTFEFAGLARLLARAARGCGVQAPSFRSPPRRVGVDRTIRRQGAGAAVVAVRVRGRTAPAVIADMIDGVVVANRLEAPDADRARNAMWESVMDAGWLGVRPSTTSREASDAPMAPSSAA